MAKLLSAEKALNIVLNNVKVLKKEEVRLTEALYRVLAEDVYAPESLPSFINSAMDGYAVKSQDLRYARQEKPVILKLIEDLPAGYLPKKKVKTDETIKIMTGAVLPSGADAVVKVEDTEISLQNKKKLVKIFHPVEKGENIRQIGEDVKKGELVLSKGKTIRAQEIALLAALGKDKVKIFSRPKVAVLTTGDELVGVKEKLKPGKIRDSNSYMLEAEIINSGAIPLSFGIIEDRKKTLKNVFSQAVEKANLILSSAGVSVGEYDLVKDCLLEMGLKLKFHTLAIRPGKPLLFGLLRNKPVFGLPGNPVSSMVTFELFVRPAILKMRGENGYSLPKSEAIIGEKVVKKKGLCYYLRGKLEQVNNKWYVKTTGPQGSGIISSLVKADCLIVLPEEKTVVNKGEKVKILFF